MEEVDSIIVQSLQEIGCELEEGVNINNISAEDVYKSIRSLLKIINSDVVDEIPTNLPNQLAMKFSAASQLVDGCKKIGFNGDLGYQTILYSNVNEIRRIFMFLIEHLPKSDEKIDSFQDSRTMSRAKATERQIAKKLALSLKEPWILPILQDPVNSKFITNDLEIPFDNGNKKLSPIFYQTKNIIPSVISHHDKLLTKSQENADDMSRKLRSSMVKSTQSLHLLSSPTKSILSAHHEENEAIITQDELEKQLPKIKSQLELLAEQVEEIKEKVDEQEELFQQLSLDKEKLLNEFNDEKVNLAKIKKDGKLTIQLGLLLDTPDESIKKLQTTYESMKLKRENMSAKFQAHKKPLDEELESYAGKNSEKIQKIQEARAIVKNVRRSVREIHEDIKSKVEMQENLRAELSNMKRSTERSQYTMRIGDIIKNIKKQNQDINYVLKDTRDLQKSINNIEGMLQRQFTITEELVWTKVMS
jgi:hypothetical protein